MGLNDFWINNNGKKEQLNNIKHGVRKDQLGEKYQPLFDVYDVNKDGTLEDEELSNVFRSLSSFAGDDKTLDRAESSHAGNVFATQKNIEDADFMGFVKSVSDASQEIKSSTTKPTPDGGKEITTVYEDGTTETISYYPNGEYKFKKTEKHTQITTQYYTIGTNVDKEYSKAQLEQKIKSDYKKYKQNMASNNNKRDSSFSQMILPYEYFKAQYMSHVNMGESNQRFDMYKVELSETAQADVEVRDFVLNHFIETHKQTKETLDTMGIFAEVGAAINTGAGELWNTSKNIYNKYFGDGTEEDYKNFYELLRQFSPSMADAKENGLKLATGNPVIIAHTLYDMVTSDGNSELGSYEKALNSESTLNNARNHPEEYFRSYETEFQFNTGHQYSIEQAIRFRETTERYQQATTIKEGLELLHEAMREVEQYSVDKDIQTYQAMPGDYMNPSGHIKKATELLLQYFKGDQEKVNIILEGSLGDENAKVVQAIKDLYKNNEKLLDMVITNERIVEGYTADGIHTKTTIKSDTKTYEQLQEQYRAQYKEMYGTDFVPDELTSEVQLAQETGGMVKLGVIMVVTSLITRNPAIASMLETSGAASAGVAMTGEASAFIQNLVTKYGAEAVAQGIKLAMLGEQVVLDASLTLLDQVTSEAGVRGGELGQSVAGTTGFMTFATYIGGPLAGQVSKAVAGKLGVKSVLSMGTKTTTGAIETTKMSGSKFLNIANISDKVGKAAGTGAGFVTEVGAFSLYELAMSDESIAKILEEQTGTLGKIKIMSHVLEYMLGRKVYSKVENAKIDAARKASGVDNWEIRQDTRPTLDGKGTQSIITVEVDGIQIGKFNNETELRLAMVDRVSKAYEEMGSTGAETPAETRSEEGVETEETYLGIIDSKGIKPVEDKVRQQWQQSDIETLAVEEKVDLFHLDQEAGLKGKPLTVENEVTDLILHGKLSENLSARYKEMGNVFTEIIQKHTNDIKQLAEQYPNNKQKVAEGIIKILAKEFGMEGFEPPVAVGDFGSINLEGTTSPIEGKIYINEKVSDLSSLTEIITHEFVHMMQIRDVIAQYGEQGLRVLVQKNKSIPEDQKDTWVKSILENDYNKKLLEIYNAQKAKSGSVDDYFNRIYKDEFTNPETFNGVDEYLNQVTEFEAYKLGSKTANENTRSLAGTKLEETQSATQTDIETSSAVGGRVDEIRPNRPVGQIRNIETGEYENISFDIEGEPSSSGKFYITALNENGDVIGKAKIDNTSGNSTQKGLYISFIGTSEKYNGIGSELVREVVKYSEQVGLDGEVWLNAVTGDLPPEFGVIAANRNRTQENSTSAAVAYKRMGFEATNAEIDTKISEEISRGGSGMDYNNNRKPDMFGGTIMRLSQAAINKFKTQNTEIANQKAQQETLPQLDIMEELKKSGINYKYKIEELNEPVEELEGTKHLTHILLYDKDGNLESHMYIDADNGRFIMYEPLNIPKEIIITEALDSAWKDGETIAPSSEEVASQLKTDFLKNVRNGFKIKTNKLTLTADGKRPINTIMNNETGELETIRFEKNYNTSNDGRHTSGDDFKLEAYNSSGEMIGIVEVEPNIYEMNGTDAPIGLRYMITSDEYTGVGTELVRQAVEYSQKSGHHGRIRIRCSTGEVPANDQGFGYFGFNKVKDTSAAIKFTKMGFRAVDESIAKQIDEAIASGDNGLVKGGKFKDRFENTIMELSEEKIAEYLQQPSTTTESKIENSVQAAVETSSAVGGKVDGIRLTKSVEQADVVSPTISMTTETLRYKTKRGELKEFTLERQYETEYHENDTSVEITYTVKTDDGTEVGNWTGTVYSSEAESYIKGHWLYSNLSGVKTEGLGTQLKELIKQEAQKYNCSEIRIVAGLQSHTFHNKMGYKCNISDAQVRELIQVLKYVKRKGECPEFNDRIDEVIKSQDKQQINSLLDDLLTYANNNNLSSSEIGIFNINIPMKYNVQAEVETSIIPDFSKDNIFSSAEELSGIEYLNIIKNTKMNEYGSQICVGTGGEQSPNAIVNKYLRTGKINSNYSETEIQEIINDADNLIEQNSLSTNTILYRNIKELSYIPEVGETFVEKGYTATSRTDNFPNYDYGSINVEIYVPKGTKCFIPGNMFQEIVLGRNAIYKVIEKSENHIILALIGCE